MTTGQGNRYGTQSIVYASMWFLPTNVHKEWCVELYYRNDKESITFQWQKPLIFQHDVNTDIS